MEKKNSMSQHKQGDKIITNTYGLYVKRPIYDPHAVYTGRLCPQCGCELEDYDGGDQGGVPFTYCSDGCGYEER